MDHEFVWSQLIMMMEWRESESWKKNAGKLSDGFEWHCQSNGSMESTYDMFWYSIIPLGLITMIFPSMIKWLRIMMYMYKKPWSCNHRKHLNSLWKSGCINERRKNIIRDLVKSHMLKMKRLQRMLRKWHDRHQDRRMTIWVSFWFHTIDNHYCLLWLFIDR